MINRPPCIDASLINWSKLFRDAQSEKVTCVVYHNLCQSGYINQIDHKTRVNFEMVQNHVLARNILANDLFRRISQMLVAEGIEVIPLKGVYLLNFIYKLPGLRDMGDIDILVKSQDTHRAHQVLTKSGFKISPPTFPLRKLGKYGYLNSIAFYGDSQNFYTPVIHLHWHIVNASIPIYLSLGNIDINQIWQESAETEFNGTKIRVMRPEHALITLCEHLVKHSYISLIYFVDISMFLQRQDISVALFSRICHKWGVERIVYLALYFTDMLFGDKKLKGILNELDGADTSFERRIVEYYFLKEKCWHGLGTLTHLYQLKNIIKKFLFLWGTFFPPKDELLHFGKTPGAGGVAVRLKNLLRLLAWF
jgi:hypothetical protein